MFSCNLCILSTCFTLPNFAKNDYFANNEFYKKTNKCFYAKIQFCLHIKYWPRNTTKFHEKLITKISIQGKRFFREIQKNPNLFPAHASFQKRQNGQFTHKPVVPEQEIRTSPPSCLPLSVRFV
jgi:hypothetical protein